MNLAWSMTNKANEHLARPFTDLVRLVSTSNAIGAWDYVIGPHSQLGTQKNQVLKQGL